MSTAVLFAPDEEAMGLARQLEGAEDVHREIINETLTSAENGQIKESGRTVCGSLSKVLSPIARFSKRVTLDSCPRGASGGLHSHVTLDELQTPHNSLPDIATVMYGQMDVSGVVGTDSMELVVRADDGDAAKEVFNDIVGVEGSSPNRVVNAVLSGDIDPDRAHTEVRRRLGSLFLTSQTGYHDLRRHAESLFPLDNPVEFGQYDAHEAAVFQIVMQQEEPRNTFEKLDDVGDQVEQVETPGDDSLRNLAIGAAVGTVVGTVIEKVVIDRIFVK